MVKYNGFEGVHVLRGLTVHTYTGQVMCRNIVKNIIRLITAEILM